MPGESELTGRGVSYCATCDGWFFKDKKVVVVGGGDSALEEGIFLTRYASSVTIIHRRDSLRAGQILQKRAFDNEKVNFIWNTVVTEIIGKEAVETLRLKNIVTGEETLFPAHGIFIFIGHTPNTSSSRASWRWTRAGISSSIKRCRPASPEFLRPGKPPIRTYRQVVTSAGMGAAAAMQAIRYIEENTKETEKALE